MLKSREFLREKSRGEGSGLHRPWCQKILGTGPSMTGGRGAGFVRLLSRYTSRNDTERNGEGLHRPWCHKILGTDCASRPRITGGRGAGFVRLLRSVCNDGASNDDGLPHPWCHKILGTDCASRPRMTGGRGANSFGRSMIEMLGVLAIIAVLSVGGIAGYSKAMEMFKINKIIEEYNYFIAGLLEHLPDYEKLNKDSSQLYLTEFAIAANLTPTTWKNYDNWTIIDSQNHMVWPFVRGGHLVFEIGIVDQSSGNILPHSTNLDYCRALYRNVMQPLHGAVSRVTFYRHQTDNSSYVYYGDGYCGNENKCLSELSLSAIDEMCKSCTDKNPWCHIVMTF